jgi:threonine aldolase
MIVDLRTDFISRPTAAMRRAMDDAATVSPGFGPREDPIVSRLETLAAETLGKEDALFCPTCTMANQIAVHLHCARGQTFLSEPTSHIALYEQGAFAALSGVFPLFVPREGNAPDVRAARAAMRPSRPLDARVSLIWIENTHVQSSGGVVEVARLRALRGVADEGGAAVHLDGARIFNAAVALGVEAAHLASFADSVAVSLNKGLGAPLGAILAGPKAFIAEAARARQLFGGGWRPATIPAAAGVVALQAGPGRLAEDHENAARLARGLARFEGLTIDPAVIRTNIVLTDVSGLGVSAPDVAAALEKAGVRVSAFAPNFIRFVTHADIDEAAVDHALQAVEATIRAMRP